jgi:hypothetical protein
MFFMFSSTQQRVAEHSAAESNARLHEQARERIARSLRSGRVDARLAELDREWDTERTLQTNFALVTLASLALGAFVDRRWLLLTGAAAGFMLQHALQGWCPPLAVFRRRGYRDAGEIERERQALIAAYRR